MSDPDDPLWFGHGGYGEYGFIGENSIKEYGEFFSGGQYFQKESVDRRDLPSGQILELEILIFTTTICFYKPN